MFGDEASWFCWDWSRLLSFSLSSGLGTLCKSFHLTAPSTKFQLTWGLFLPIAAMQTLCEDWYIAAVASRLRAGFGLLASRLWLLGYAGKRLIDKVLPPMLALLSWWLALNLAANAVNDATTLNKSYSIYALWFRWRPSLVVILFNMYGKKIIGVIPIYLD